MYGTLAFCNTMKCAKKTMKDYLPRRLKVLNIKGGGLSLMQMRNVWNEKQYRVTKTLTSHTLELPNYYQTNRAPWKVAAVVKKKTV